MTILEFIKKTKETFNISGSITFGICHTEDNYRVAITLADLESDVDSYNHWSIERFSCGDVEITFFTD